MQATTALQLNYGDQLQMTTTDHSNAGGVALTAFIVAVAVSLTYYQFFYIPEASLRPIVPQEVLELADITEVLVAVGSSDPNNDRFFVPSSVRATLGESNKVVWTNEDSVPHTVTTDDGYNDPYSGVFDSRERPQEEGGPFLLEGETYEFLFTEIGEYPYHCEPHPWMQGVVQVIESFS
jgi:plastocyanin